MTPSAVRTIAVFDLDGTLTRRDTLLPFLRRTRGTASTAWGFLVHGPAIARGLVRPGRRHGVKEALLSHLLRGRPMEALKETAEAFAEEVVAGGLRAPVLARVEQHRRAGHELAIVSASPALYVEPVGRRLGFDVVLATGLEVDQTGRLTGRLAGPNCRGREKVARLRAWTGDGPVVIHAYGDSAGDRELLAAADVGCRLRRGRLPPLEEAGQASVRGGC